MILKRNLLIILLPILAISACSQSHKNKSKSESGSQKMLIKSESISSTPINDFTYLPTTKRGVIYKKANYAHSYSATDFQSEWVAYYLTKSETEGTEDRSNNFQTDQTIPGSPDKLDYNQTGYDRGHQAPAADMKFSIQAMEECFYMTNMSPQEPSFNRGIWKDLEEDVRSWTQEKGTLYVVTGALFEQDKRMRKSKITIPTHFYKILLDVNGAQPKMVALLLPNAEGSRPISKYAISVDELEKRSGIDYFSQLPDSIEDFLERTVDLATWGDGIVLDHSNTSTTQNTSTNLVYVCSTSKGKKYHKEECNGLNKCKGITLNYTIEKAKKLGYLPCGTCY